MGSRGPLEGAGRGGAGGGVGAGPCVLVLLLGPAPPGSGAVEARRGASRGVSKPSRALGSSDSWGFAVGGPGSCVPGKAAVAAVGARTEGESREARNGGAGRLDRLESRSSPAASKSRVQAALGERLDARRTCREAGSRGSGRWGRWPGARSLPSVEGGSGFALFLARLDCKGTLPIVPR